MHPLRPLLLPSKRSRSGIAVRRLGARSTLDEPDGLTVRHIDGGEQDEAGHAHDGIRLPHTARVTDVIGWDDTDVPSRRRWRLPRWSWAVVGVLVAGAALVPIGARQLATAAARDVAKTWVAAKADDEARLTSLALVVTKLGSHDTPWLAQALHKLDLETVNALEHHRRHLRSMRTWAADTKHAAAAAATALNAQIAGLRAEAAHAADVAANATITDPTVATGTATNLNTAAGRLIDAMLKSHHVRTPKIRSFRLHAADDVIAVLNRPTDTLIHLRLLVSSPGGLDLYDLDTSRHVGHVIDQPNDQFNSVEIAGPNIVTSYDEATEVVAPSGHVLRRLDGAITYAASNGLWTVRLTPTSGTVQHLDDNGAALHAPIPFPHGWYPAGMEADGTMLLGGQSSELGLWSPGRSHVRPVAAECATNLAAAGPVAAFVAGRACAPETLVVLTSSQRYDVQAPADLTYLGIPVIDSTGQHIAITLANSQGDGSLSPRLGIVDVATGELTLLPVSIEATPESWSPDGRWLLVRNADPLEPGRLALWQLGGDGRLRSVRLAISGDAILVPSSFGD